MLIEQAEALGEPPEDPLLLFSVLYGFWVASLRGVQWRRGARACDAVPGARGAAKGDGPAHDRASAHGQFAAASPGTLPKGERISISAFALYDPAEHRPLATRFGQDVGVAILSWRSLALWLLGYPEAALADVDRALEDAREIGQAATLMSALMSHALTHISLRRLRGGKRAIAMNLSLWRRKKAPCFGRRVGC